MNNKRIGIALEQHIVITNTQLATLAKIRGGAK